MIVIKKKKKNIIDALTVMCVALHLLFFFKFQVQHISQKQFMFEKIFVIYEYSIPCIYNFYVFCFCFLYSYIWNILFVRRCDYTAPSIYSFNSYFNFLFILVLFFLLSCLPCYPPFNCIFCVYIVNIS